MPKEHFKVKYPLDKDLAEHFTRSIRNQKCTLKQENNAAKGKLA